MVASSFVRQALRSIAVGLLIGCRVNPTVLELTLGNLWHTR
jgi:hypothetical protein